MTSERRFTLPSGVLTSIPPVTNHEDLMSLLEQGYIITKQVTEVCKWTDPRNPSLHMYRNAVGVTSTALTHAFSHDRQVKHSLQALQDQLHVDDDATHHLGSHDPSSVGEDRGDRMLAILKEVINQCVELLKYILTMVDEDTRQAPDRPDWVALGTKVRALINRLLVLVGCDVVSETPSDEEWSGQV